MTDPGWRVVDAGYSSWCAVCREGDRPLVALPLSIGPGATPSAVWLCRDCALGAVACLNRRGRAWYADKPWNRGVSPLLHTPTPGFADGDLRRCRNCGDTRQSHRQTTDGRVGVCLECECAGYEA